ncbi:MAG TPA: glycosyltransferase family 4 protein [Pyrinomonadaceae bacterium]|nr:glycosyltransferase family 4 protein [Pyrinomonadaceae bacterium]
MRVLQINSARAFGGGERHLTDLTEGLARRGHEVFVAHAPGSPLGAGLARAVPRENLIPLRMRNALDLPSALALARAARDRRVDMIHAHAGRDYTLAALASRLAPRARLVLTRHVMFPLGRAHALTLRRAARVVAVSEAVARSLRASRVFAEDKIRVVRNGIDVERFARAAADVNRAECRRSLGAGARLLVGTVGTLSEVKGQDVFVRAARLVADELGEAVEFVVVGEDESRGANFKARLAALVKELSLDGRVHFLGRRADVAEILACLDLYVSASRSEAFGLASVEAMASGLPVVAAATDGAREIVVDGETGALAPAGDARALAERMLLFLSDDARRKRAGASAQERARGLWGLARMIDETVQVYREALEA